jgi:cystathionine beta-lyase
MKQETKIIALGRDPKANFGAVNPPVYHVSTILFPTLEKFDEAERGKAPIPSYGRYGSKSTQALERELAELEGADHCIVTTSGMSAIVLVLNALLAQGDHILVADTVYGPMRRYCDQELTRFGVQVTYYDPLIGAGIGALMKPNTKVVYTESPGSQTLEVMDIPAISKVAHEKGATVVLDNTWATPFFFRPYDHGVDICIQSGTKYISGHSDLVMGVITCREAFYKPVLRSFRNMGAVLGPDDAYLAQRGLRTVAVRLKQHQETGLALAKWLEKRPEVVKVLHPALPSCPGHEIWKRDFLGATSLFSVILKSYPRPALAAMLDNLEHYGMGYSWGGYESLIIPFTPPRTAKPWTHDGINLRIHAGLEHVDDLIADLDAGFERLNAAK